MAKVEKNIINKLPIETSTVKPVKVNKLVPPAQQPAKPSETVKSSKPDATKLQEVIGASKSILARGVFGANPTEAKLNRVGGVPFAGAKISQGFGNLEEHFNKPLTESDRLILGVAFQSVVANNLHQKIS